MTCNKHHSGHSKCHKHCPPIQQPFKPLNILISNDDGISSNVTEMWDQLKASGHNLYGFLPQTNMSGLGSGFLTTSNISFVPFDSVNFPNLFICTTVNTTCPQPTTQECIQSGLSWMKNNNLNVDMIISGPNNGNNVGSAYIVSGTVGGIVVAAAGFTVPEYQNAALIAVNIGSNRSSARRLLTANFIRNLVDYLDMHRKPDGTMLPKGVYLNINIPSYDSQLYIESCGTQIVDSPINGVVLTKMSRNIAGSPFFPDQINRNMYKKYQTVSTNTGLGPFASFPTSLTIDTGFSNGYTNQIVAAQPYDANTPLTNAAQVAGNIVLIQRGGCIFSVKTRNAINAGAAGIIFVNNNSSALSVPGAVFYQTRQIPTVFISQADGEAIKTQLDAMTPVNITVNDLLVDGNTQWTYTEVLEKTPVDLEESSCNDITSLANYYITITPGKAATTCGVGKKVIQELCCLLKPCLTIGPSLCKSTNIQSVLLQEPSGPTPNSMVLQSYADQEDGNDNKEVWQIQNSF